jgi:hypothetical protein
MQALLWKLNVLGFYVWIVVLSGEPNCERWSAGRTRDGNTDGLSGLVLDQPATNCEKLERRTEEYERKLESGVDLFRFTKIRVMRFYFLGIQFCATRSCFLQVLQDGRNSVLSCGVTRDEVRRDEE